MAKALAEPGERLEDAAGTSQSPVANGVTVPDVRPFNFDRLLEVGATLHGVPVLSVRIVTADGRQQTLAFRSVEDADAPKIRAKILKTLQASRLPLTRKQMALEMKLKTVRGRFGIEVSAMVEDQEIFEEDGLYTDDRSKFGGVN